MNELVQIEESNAMEVFISPNGLDPFLAKVRAEIDGFTPDIATKKGRDAVASIAHKVAKSKTYLDNVGKELVSKLKEQPKLVDAERKRMRDLLDAWKDEVRKPLTEWEEAEKNRVAKHEHSISKIVNYRLFEIEISSCTLQKLLKELESISIDSSYEEFELEARKQKEASLAFLNAELPKILAKEAEQAELAALRKAAEAQAQKDREEKIARDAAEKAKAEAENAANAEREASERRELDAKLAAERAEREKVEAEQRAVRAEQEAEQRALNAVKESERQAQAKLDAEKLATEKREANARHVKSVKTEAYKALIANDVDKDVAIKVINLIHDGLIPNISISY
jgi:hypothetical protein